MSRCRFSLWVILVCLLTTFANAAEKLEADLIPVVLRARNGAPIPVDARFKWTGTRVLEGKLELEFHDGQAILGRYRTDDLDLTTGEQRFRILLPPLLQPESDSQVEVRMKFLTADGPLNLDSTSLFLPTINERSLAMGWCNARVDSAPHAPDLEQSLMLERFSPELTPSTQRELLTSLVRLAPEDLSMQPLSYTAYDVMVLTAEGFAEAHEAQLQTLARWVKGGGSVCVFVGGGLQSHHLAFLNELIDTNSAGPVFMADDKGNLLPGMQKISCLRSGVGRSVIVTGDLQPDPGLNSQAWREAVAFLWKIRDNQRQSILASGHWEAPTNFNWQASFPTQANQPGRPYRPRRPPQMASMPSPMYYGIQSTSFGAELITQLIPKTVRLIPFPALLATLGVFLLMIGPADYFLLGWLRRRRYTWVLFPVMSIVFTLGTVTMANHYLGLRDQRRSLIVVDVDKDGMPVRSDRYELIFAARDKQSVTELKDALWAPLESQMLPDMSQFRVTAAMMRRGGVYSYNSQPYSYRSGVINAGEDAAPPWYEGTLPAHFRTSKSLRQWRPELNRVFSFDASSAPALTNWSAIEEAWPKLQDIRAKLSANKNFAGDVCAVTMYPSDTFGPGATEVAANADAPEFETGGMNSDQADAVASPWHVMFDSSSTRILHASTLTRLCVGDLSSRLLSLVSQISPTGGGNYEDVQVLDANDSALLIVTEVGDDIVVYRRIFHAN